MGRVELAPAAVVRRFGQPSPGDGNKISGEYAFLSERGEAFVLHDWLSTNLIYEAAPPPERFWASTEPIELSISSLDLEVTEFAEWIRSEVSGPPVLTLNWTGPEGN